MQQANLMSSLPLRSSKQPAFVVIVVILFLAAAGLNAAISYMKLSFKEAPVEPGRPLADVPTRLGQWVQVSVDEALDHDMREALATDKYIFRDYVDSTIRYSN